MGLFCAPLMMGSDMGCSQNADFQYKTKNNRSVYQLLGDLTNDFCNGFKEAESTVLKDSNFPKIGELYNELIETIKNPDFEFMSKNFSTGLLGFEPVPGFTYCCIPSGPALSLGNLPGIKSIAGNNNKLKMFKDALISCKGMPSLDELSKAGQVMERGGLTKAGRALQKHGGRPGSAFPKPNGNITRINLHGQVILDNILTHPDGIVHFRTHKQFGEIIDIKVPNIGGVRFTKNKEMIGFLEP